MNAHVGAVRQLTARPPLIDVDDEDCIRIWRFHEAPRELSEGMGHSGDEEWIVAVPERLKEDAERWFDLRLRANHQGHSAKLLCYKVRRVPGGFIVSTAHS